MCYEIISYQVFYQAKWDGVNLNAYNWVKEANL